ncbi:MAG: amino acid ABC transporter permease [Anaerolineae bacterium]
MATVEEIERPQPKLIPWSQRLADLPWWVLIVLIAGLVIVYTILNSDIYRDTFLFLIEGVKLTVMVTLISFSIALVLGLITSLGRVSSKPVIYTISSLYVEVVRGVPLLVQIIYVAFVIVPLFVQLLNGLGELMLRQSIFDPLGQLALSLANLSIKNVDMSLRAMVGLAIGYGAYEAEVFRAGIESISKGQMEAARSLGMSYAQAMRYIILPQAIRVVLPPLGNDFIAMLKDSSLISALAVTELTQLGKLNRARTFRTFETWNMVTFLYLSMTLLLSLLVKFLERRMAIEK